jgi:GNAT superfamily N-acetyltransferase
MAVEPTLRVMTPDEAPAVISLMQKIGWNHTLEQTRQNITWGGGGSFCLAFDKHIVTTAIALKYSQRLAWVGLVVSDPEYQRRGFARRLMNHVMQYLSDVESVMLDASVAGFPLYDSMDFQSLYKINVYAGTPQRFSPSAAIRPMTSEDLPTVIDMDCTIMGLPRPRVLNWLFEAGNAYVATDSGKITGYTFTRTQADALRLVAWNAQDTATAEALFQFGSTLAVEGNFSLHVSIPEPNVAAREIAERYNLIPDRYVTRMVYGKQPPGRMGEQYGIIAFMTG